MVALAINYPYLAQVAQQMIAANGQRVTFTRNSRTPANPAQPWRGPNLSSPLTLSLIAVVIPNSQLDDPEAMRRGDARAYVAAENPGEQVIKFSDGATLDQADNMTDVDGIIWHVHGADILNPGGVRILYQVVLAH